MGKFIEFTKSKKMKFHFLHTSGHAKIEILKKVVDMLKPKEIIPIHTFYPDKYEIFGADVHQLLDGETHEV